MQLREVGRIPTRLPADDDHPYRTGAWLPNQIEYDADELDVIEGMGHDLPRALWPEITERIAALVQCAQARTA